MRHVSDLLLLLLLFLFTHGYATQPYRPEVVNPFTQSWRWRHFPELEGKGVRCIVEDGRGIVWFGVNEGIIEYDGYEWKWHKVDDGLLGSPVEKLYAGKNGAIYAATSKGLFEYLEGRWRNLLFFSGDLEITFHQIRELSSGHLMLCTHLGVFEIQQDRKIRVFTSEANRRTLSGSVTGADWIMLPEGVLSDGNFLDISDALEVQPGRIWMSITLEGHSKILSFDPGKIRDGTIRDFQILDNARTWKIPFGETQKMLKAHDQSIWMVNTSTNVGIHQFDGKRWSYFELSDQFGGDEFATDIVQSTDGTIWVGGLGKLYTCKDGKWEMYESPKYKIPANRLMLIQSRKNNIWIGGHKSMVYRLDYSATSWLTYKNLNFQCERNRQEQWFLEVSGKVVKRLGNSWKAYDTSDGLMDAPVRVIVTSQGQIWAAGSHQGVAATAFLEDDQWYMQTHPALSWGIDYRAVFEARDGSLWFGGAVDFFKETGQSGGVIQLKNPIAKAFSWIHHKYHENGLLQSNAYGIGQSPDGRIWIGGGNLFYYDGCSWDRPEHSCLRQYVNIVHSTDDLLLVGSRYYGIFLFDGKEWKQYDTDSGLRSNTIISLHVDAGGHIWVATENDISRFDGESWVNHIFPGEMNMNFEGGAILHSSDGAIWVNKSSREWKRRAFSHSKTPGEMYQNFIAYRYLPDKNPPETSIELYTAEVSSDGNTLISWIGEDYLGDTPDERLLYSYRLDGSPWSPFAAEEHHTFLNLASGDHTLEVRARDLDFNVDPTPAVINFAVQSPVWKQKWFVSLVMTFLVIIGIFEYRIITKKQKLEKLNSSLNLINAALKEKNEQVLQQQEQILAQKKELEISNFNLEEQNLKIQDQRDKLEEMVKQVEELSKSKINFFTNISHELRTPLTLILGPIEQLQDNTYPVSEKKRKRLLEIVERNACRLLELINQLLEIRRIENNTLELNLVNSNLGQFVAEITGLFENLAREQDIHLFFQNDCNNPLTAFDPDKIEKIIANLLSNAFKNTPGGGRIGVKLEENRRGNRRFFQIVVEDTGKGICPEKLKRIFERYYSDSQDQVSSGIGLAYIKDLVELHSGKIEVSSTQGKGTQFVISIPADLDANQEIEKGWAASGNGMRAANLEVNYLKVLNSGKVMLHPKPVSSIDMQRILVVEDNKDMVDFLESILGGKYSVLKARNGREGLRIAQNHHLDLIVSDVMMPEMDGLEFCHRIKSDFSTSHIPLILLTAKNMDEHIMEGYTTGADDYMTKPFNPELLINRIDNLLLQRQQLRTKFIRDFKLQPKEVRLTSPDEGLLHRVVEIMEEHISDSDFNVNKLCEMVHLSHMHFIRKMKLLTGKKPIDLLKSYRMKRAKDLLKQNKANIAEIAYMVGYDLPNSFSRAFKKEFGFSPTEYLESLELSSSLDAAREER